MPADNSVNRLRTAVAAVLLALLPLAAAIVGCGLGGDSRQGRGLDEGSSADAAPIRAGWVLVLRDGDLWLLAGHWERQVTHTGDFWTGALTRDGSVIGVRSADGGGSALVRLEVGESTVTQTTEVALAREPPDWGPYPGYLAVSPDGTRVLAGGVLVELDSGRRTEPEPGGLGAVWSADGSHVAYLSPAGDWDPDSQTVRRFDLWVEDIRNGDAPRRVAAGLMDWFDMFGRDAESIAWSKDGTKILALSADGAKWVERRWGGYGLSGPVNNRLVSVDVETGEERVLASSLDLHRRLEGEVDVLAAEVVVSAAATHRDGVRAAFLVMDYERAYGIGLLDADGRLDRLIVETAPGRHTVNMGAPVWFPDGDTVGLLRLVHEHPEAVHRRPGRRDRRRRQGLGVDRVPEARPLGHLAGRQVGLDSRLHRPPRRPQVDDRPEHARERGPPGVRRARRRHRPGLVLRPPG